MGSVDGTRGSVGKLGCLAIPEGVDLAGTEVAGVLRVMECHGGSGLGRGGPGADSGMPTPDAPLWGIAPSCLLSAKRIPAFLVPLLPLDPEESSWGRAWDGARCVWALWPHGQPGQSPRGEKRQRPDDPDLEGGQGLSEGARGDVRKPWLGRLLRNSFPVVAQWKRIQLGTMRMRD